MNKIILTLTLFNGIGFLIHGSSCLYSKAMHKEFARYGLSKQRPLVGVLQLAGAVGLLCGLYFQPLALTSAAGLALIMTMGVVVRFRVNDRFVQMIPALGYAISNYVLVFLLYKAGAF